MIVDFQQLMLHIYIYYIIYILIAPAAVSQVAAAAAAPGAAETPRERGTGAARFEPLEDPSSADDDAGEGTEGVPPLQGKKICCASWCETYNVKYCIGSQLYQLNNVAT